MGERVAKNSLAGSYTAPSTMKAFRSKMAKYVGPRHSKSDVEKNYKLGKELGWCVLKISVIRCKYKQLRGKRLASNLTL